VMRSIHLANHPYKSDVPSGTKVIFRDVEIVYEVGWGCVKYGSIMLRKVEAEKGLRRKSFAPDWIALS